MSVVGEKSLGQGLVTNTPEGRTALVVSRCTSCGDVRCPPRTVCPIDLAACELDSVEGDATVYEVVRMGIAPLGFSAPYWVGLIDFPQGFRIFGLIASDDEDPVMAGDQVSMIVGVIGSDPTGLVGPVFQRSSRSTSPQITEGQRS